VSDGYLFIVRRSLLLFPLLIAFMHYNIDSVRTFGRSFVPLCGPVLRGDYEFTDIIVPVDYCDYCYCSGGGEHYDCIVDCVFPIIVNR